MVRQKHRRVLDSAVKSAGDACLSVEIYLSDNGVPLVLYTKFRLPVLRIESAALETAHEDGAPAPWISFENLPQLEGLEVGRGFVTTIESKLAGQKHPEALLDALVESARMLAQIGMVSYEKIKSMELPDSSAFRQMDLTIWPELLDSCITYSKESEPFFKDGDVIFTGRFDCYGGRPGQIYRFRRDKILECRLSEREHDLSAHLSDDFHELKIMMTIEPEHQIIKVLTADWIRLPYQGLCNRPFHRATNLAGLSLGSDFKNQVVHTVGGRTGCIHLADLILDLTRYYKKIV